MIKLFKKIIFICVILIIIFLILFGVSYIPRKIDKSFDAVMYRKGAYLIKDYDNLDLKKTTIHIEGKLYKRWFRNSLFVGYIDTDISPVDKAVTKEANIFIKYPKPNAITYYSWNNGLYSFHYATAYFDNDLEKFYIEYEEASGNEGYCLAAPAKNLEEIEDIQKEVLKMANMQSRIFHLEDSTEKAKFEQMRSITLCSDGTAEIAMALFSSYLPPKCTYSIENGELLLYAFIDNELDEKFFGIKDGKIVARFTVEDEEILIFRSASIPLSARVGTRYVYSEFDIPEIELN